MRRTGAGKVGTLAVLVALAVTPPLAARAEQDLDTSPAAPVEQVRPRGTTLGLQLDAGVPDAAGVVLLYRPLWWLRLNGGLAYDYIGYGLRGGVSLVPWHWVVTPSLSLDAGRFFEGDASRLASDTTRAERDLLRHATYQFASAQVGLELGSQRWCSFYVRAGLAYVTATASGRRLTAFAQEKGSDSSMQYSLGDARLRALMPSASLGLLFYVR